MARQAKQKRPDKAKSNKGKPDRGRAAKSGGRGGATVFALAVFLLIAGAAGVVAWLQLTYDPAAEYALPVVEGDLAQPVAPAQPMTAAKPDETPSSNAGHGTPPAPATDTATHEAPKPTDPAADTAATQPPAAAAPAQGTGADAGTPPAAPPTAMTGPAAPSTQDHAAAPADAAPPPPVPAIIELAPVPDPALVKETPNGPLPIIAADGRTALQVYARPHRETGRPRVAVVLGSLGLSRAATTAAIQQLPAPITLAFAPYGRNLQEYIGLARAAGHEVMLQLPMEPVDYPTNDPGPHTLLTTLPARKNLERLEWLLGRFTGYVGVMNYMGSRFTASDPHLRPIMVALRDRGLMFLDARSTNASVAFNVAQDLGMPAIANDRYIDDEASRPGIDRRLQELERLARANGSAVGLAFPYPVTIERLAHWARQLGGRGIDLAPVSALIKVRKQAG